MQETDIQHPQPKLPDIRTPGSREKWVHVKATPEERDAWKAAAAAAGLTVADLFRQKMAAKLEGRAPKKTRAARRADPKLIQAAGRIGSNLNQIAKWCNTHAAGADAVQVLAALVAIDQALGVLTSSSYRPDVGLLDVPQDPGDAE